MSISRKAKKVAILLAALLLVVMASLAAQSFRTLPPLLSLVLIPGTAISIALAGGSVHDTSPETIVMMNIVFWVALLGGAALVIIRKPEE